MGLALDWKARNMVVEMDCPYQASIETITKACKSQAFPRTTPPKLGNRRCSYTATCYRPRSGHTAMPPMPLWVSTSAVGFWPRARAPMLRAGARSQMCAFGAMSFLAVPISLRSSGRYFIQTRASAKETVKKSQQTADMCNSGAA